MMFLTTPAERLQIALQESQDEIQAVLEWERELSHQEAAELSPSAQLHYDF